MRSVLSSVAVVLVSTALAVLAAEGALRLLDRDRVEVPPGGNHPRFLFVENAVTGYTLRPGFTGEMVNPHGDFRIPVAVDSLGNRRTSAVESSPGLVILGLGDSFTYGEGVPADSTYLARLQSSCARSGIRTRVVLGGVPGYSAQQMLDRFRVLTSAAPPPDITVLGLVPSAGDRLDDPFAYHEGFIVRSSYALQLVSVGDRLYRSGFRSSTLRRVDATLQDRSRFWRRLVGLLDGASRPGPRRPAPAPAPPPGAGRAGPPPNHPGMERVLRELSAHAGAIGTRLVVVFIDSPGESEAEAAAVCRELGVPYVRTIRSLRRFADETGNAIAFVHDDHWTAAAHGHVHERLRERLEELGWIPAAS